MSALCSTFAESNILQMFSQIMSYYILVRNGVYIDIFHFRIEKKIFNCQEVSILRVSADTVELQWLEH